MHGRWRRAALWAAVAVLATTAGIVSGSSPVAGKVDADATVPFSCQFPSGTQTVSVRVSASVPASAVAGQAIQVNGVHMGFSLPPKVSTESRVVAGLSVVAALQGIGVPSDWTFPPAALEPVSADPGQTPDGAGFSVSSDGVAPPVTSAVPGKLSLVATKLSLDFGSAGKVSCTTVDNSGVELATVTIAAAPDASVPRTAARTGGLLSAGGKKPRAVTRGSTDAEPECFDFEPVPGSAWVVGYSNVKKLNGAALLGPGLMDLEVGARTCVYDDHIDAYNYGYLHLPPAKATFLSFGFTPTTATMQLTQVGKALIVLTFYLDRPDSITVATSQMELRLYDMRVNGTPLDVGENCRGSRLIDAKLTGEADYSVQFGGTLAGAVTLPPLTGCGVKENLDPLLTASISGPDNFLRLTQGSLCTATDPPSCPPKIPEPQR